MTPKEYEIKTVGDFLHVPQDRIDVCLNEFKSALMRAHIVKSMDAEIQKKTGVSLPFEMYEFIWTDDGRRDEQIELNVVSP
jgi:hypothetical protein